MNPRIDRIVELIDTLSDAFYRRDQSDPKFWDALLSEVYPDPETQEELAIWAELTAPKNYSALRQFVEDSMKLPIGEYAASLRRKLLEAATCRLQAESRSEGPRELPEQDSNQERV
jgi:hypothetical protein